MPPSDGDLNAAYKRGYAKGYTIGHNGKIFEYTAPIAKIPDGMYNSIYSTYLDDGYSMYDAQINTLDDLQKIFHFTYKEV